jgi:hypothetical protein
LPPNNPPKFHFTKIPSQAEILLQTRQMELQRDLFLNKKDLILLNKQREKLLPGKRKKLGFLSKK